MDNGNILMECSVEEFNALDDLARVARGGSWGQLFSGPRDRRELMPAFDFTPLLGAVQMWISAKLHATDLRRIADDLDRALNTPEKFEGFPDDRIPGITR